MTYNLEGDWFWGPTFKSQRLIQEYLDIRSKKYGIEMEILKELGYIKCPKCGRIKPYYDFIKQGSFGGGNYLQCTCFYRWSRMFPHYDMMTEKEYYKVKNK